MGLIIVLITCFAMASGNKQNEDPYLVSNQYYKEPQEDTFYGSTMKAFFERNKSGFEKVLASSFEGALKVKDSVNTYVENQHRKFSNDINSYVESVKETSQKFADSWSFMPIDEPSDRLDYPDVALSVPAIIARNGYLCETHTIISQGYILNVHRIPKGKTNSASSKTILLQHGLFASSADWILNGPEKGLAYVLADAGYDVWMANIRGNKYSKEHTSLKTNSKSYWNFSWHDVALHDVPAIIDYILKLKGSATQINYIGHSMGTAILFAMLTLRPEYNKILNSGIALAPVVFLTDVKSPLKSVASIASNAAAMEMLYGSYEFMPKNSALGKLSLSCDASNPDSSVCKNVVFYICGSNEKQFNKTLLPMFLAHLGTGTSWKTAVHFSQEVLNEGKFQMFDYGYNNMRVYGTDTVPEYDLSKVTLPITLFWAENDLLSSETDVMKLYSKLPKDTTEIIKIEDPEFSHLDYLWAKDANILLNDKILEVLSNNVQNDIHFEWRFGSN